MICHLKPIRAPAHLITGSIYMQPKFQKGGVTGKLGAADKQNSSNIVLQVIVADLQNEQNSPRKIFRLQAA